MAYSVLRLAVPRTARLMDIPSGEAGIAETLRQMVKIVKQFKTDYQIRSLAAKIFRDADLAQGNFWGEVCALQQYVRDSIRYMGDVHDIDTLQTPAVTLELESGDCDDKCMLLASLLEACNHPARFIAIGLNGKGFSHVMVQTKMRKEWIPLETCRNVKAGWQPPNITTRMYAHI